MLNPTTFTYSMTPASLLEKRSMNLSPIFWNLLKNNQ